MQQACEETWRLIESDVSDGNTSIHQYVTIYRVYGAESDLTRLLLSYVGGAKRPAHCVSGWMCVLTVVSLCGIGVRGEGFVLLERLRRTR